MIMNVLFVSTMMTNDDRVWCAVLWVRELRNVHLQVFFAGEKSSEYGCHAEQTNATFEQSLSAGGAIGSYFTCGICEKFGYRS